MLQRKEETLNFQSARIWLYYDDDFFFPLQLHLIFFVCALLHTRTLVTHHASILFFRIRFLLNLTLWNHKTLRKDLKDIWHLFFCDPVLPYTAQLFYKWVLLYLTLTFFLTHLTGQTEGIVILCAFSIVDGWWCIFFAFAFLPTNFLPPNSPRIIFACCHV